MTFLLPLGVERLNLEWGMGIVSFHLAEALEEQRAGASNCSLSLFKVIYVSVKDLRMLV